MILFACAVERERPLALRRHDVEILITGVGPVEAACSIAHALAGRRYKLLVSAGIAGVLGDAAQIGDGVVVGDDALELGVENGEPILLPDGQKVVDTARSDATLVADLASKGFPVLHGITVARVTASEATAARLLQAGVQLESMEGFAALRAAERAGVPAIALRGISNRVGNRDRNAWKVDAALAGLQRIVDALFELLHATTPLTA